jgi:hypothetical protein
MRFTLGPRGAKGFPALALALGMAACAPQGDVMPGLDRMMHAPGRGDVEAFVAEHHAALLADIGAGGGTYLNLVYDLSGVAEQNRAGTTLALQGNLGLYRQSPQALALAVVAAGG